MVEERSNHSTVLREVLVNIDAIRRVACSFLSFSFFLSFFLSSKPCYTSGRTRRKEGRERSTVVVEWAVSSGPGGLQRMSPAAGSGCNERAPR